MRRPKINLTSAERAARVALGITGTVAGLVLLVSTGGTVAIVLDVLFRARRTRPCDQRRARLLPPVQEARLRAAVASGARMSAGQKPPQNRGHGHGRHGILAMIACCIPMVLIFLLIALKVI